MIRRLLLPVLLFVCASAFAQAPTPEEFLGYPLGERFTPWNRIIDYFNELQKKSNLITVQQIGETYEHRPLIVATITSPKNRAALDTIRQNVTSLADRNTSPARAAEIAKNGPAIVWLAFGVHGNESSSAEAAMAVANTLLREPAVLENLVVLIDPLENPDGRQRYIEWYTRTRGSAADPNPDSFEHTEPWPGGRYNHYLIDMNRDWAWTSQQETRAREVEYRRWFPQVFVDFHEMSANSTYFFPPDAKPINANLPKDVEKWLEVFGRANADAFTKKGWAFFVGHNYDLFYPGYGDSWPALHGAIGMTYECAGGPRGGSAYSRDDGTVLTLADRIARHYTTGISTVRTAAAHTEDLLRYTYDALHANVSSSQFTSYFISPGAPNFLPLMQMLQRQHIEMGVLGAPVTVRASRIDSDAAESRTFGAGTVVVSTRQPFGGLVQTLLEKSPFFPPGYLEEQRKKAQADEENDFYDVTSWSLPLAMNVETWVTTAPVTADIRPYSAPASQPFRPASYGYLIDGNDPNVYTAAGRMLRAGVRFSVSDDAVPVGERTLSRGTVVILKGNNAADIDARLQRVASETGVAIVPLDSGWTGGTAFGSSKIHFVRDPKIALVGGPGVSATSFGMLWHTLDIDTPVPHSTLSLDSFRNADLSRYSVIVLPDGTGYTDRIGKRGTENLQNWIRNGGTIVAIRGASGFLRSKDADISKLKTWEPPKPKDDKAPAEERYNDYSIPGATFKTSMNERSYLTFGLARPPFVIVDGTSAFLPASHAVDNIVTIARDNPLVAGVAWPESLDRIKGSVYMVAEPYGRGQVITFVDDPHYRLFWRGTLPLFMNAVLYSPSFPR
jgi:hypothetical protein